MDKKMNNTVDEEKLERIFNLCKDNGFYPEWVGRDKMSFRVQGIEISYAYYNGHSWNVYEKIHNNKMDIIVEIQSILNS